ncbi:MAG: zinc ribbon domain-containing protein [Bacteroidetes bacterium]|nr:zinc ribbon domain-containing protein [Bacteroidota bacterium]
MPTYDYRCDNCGHFFEKFQSMKDDKLTKCPECGKNTLRRLIGTGSGLIFKGTGFYLTDYKNKNSGSSTSISENKSDSGNKKSETSEKSGSSGEKKSADADKTKSDSKTKDSKTTSGKTD